MKIVHVLLIQNLLVASLSAANCADFSGHWIGTCSTSVGTTFNSQEHIQQWACDKILFGEGLGLTGGLPPYFLNGPVTTISYHLSENHTVSQSLSADWTNPQKTAVKLILTDFVKRPGQLLTSTRVSDLEINGKNLYSKFIQTSVLGDGSSKTLTTECNLTRQ